MTLSLPARFGAVLLCLILTALSQPVLSAPVQGAPGQLGDVLFPQSLAWQAVSDLQPVPAAEVTPQFKDRLAAVTDECTAQMIHKPDWPGKTSLRHGSLFAPGETDLIYVGISDCHEGYDTLIWRHADATNGFSEIGTSGRLLRIETAGDHRFTLLRAACCAEVTDDYMIGQDFPHLLRSVTVPRTEYLPFILPADSVAYPGHLILRKTVILSSAPRRVTAREATALETLQGLGAALATRRIKAGTEVTTLLRSRDKGGRYWVLIKVERPLSGEGSDGRTTAGWIPDPDKRLIRASSGSGG